VPIPDEYALLIDLATKDASVLGESSLEDLSLLERSNLQRWVEQNPEMIGSDLLLITTEFDQWELNDRKVSDRLDVLMLDKEGHLLVAELKRGEASDTTDLQALKYAAYCANLTVEDVIEMHARYAKLDEAEARSAVIEHAPTLDENELLPVRVCLLASAFGPSVSSVVLWLTEVGLDIACVQLVTRKVDAGHAVLSTRQVLPPPQAKDFLVRRRRRVEIEEQRETKKKKRQTVALLNEHQVVSPGTTLTLIPDLFPDEQRHSIEAKLVETPSYGTATWTGKPSQRALRWDGDGHESSPSSIIWRLLDELGFEPSGAHGPYFWRLPSGRSLWDEAEQIQSGEPDPATEGAEPAADGEPHATSAPEDQLPPTGAVAPETSASKPDA
jgi:hypothetical protein